MSSKRIFENTEVAFSLKNDLELRRAYSLFKMISSASLVKLGTGLTKLAFRWHLPIERIVRATVFDHFCGGVNEQDSMKVVHSLDAIGVATVLDYSVEGKEEENQFDLTQDKVLSLIDFSSEKKSMPFAVFKPTGLGRFKVWQQASVGPLNGLLQEEWERIKARYMTIVQKAQSQKIMLLIDAEESWMQDAADMLCEEMMMTFNKDYSVVFNTLQCYRHDRLAYLKKAHKEAKAKGVKLGFKVVRGAYMEKENDRALTMGYPTPICVNKQATDDMFNEVVAYILANINDISLFLGTHNEESTYKVLNLMHENGLSKNDPRIWFGQLYGMSDHITYNLANEGYNVAKYIPFGPVKDVMPYLIRRAEENTSVSGQTTRELDLIMGELSRRRRV